MEKHSAVPGENASEENYCGTTLIVPVFES